MVKKNINKKAVESKGYEDLYVNLNNVREKRSNILLSIKNSLHLQEEYEKVINIRHKKGFISKEIKKSMEDLNQQYQDLKKLLPNVKGVISYTEKELVELDGQINTLREEKQVSEEELLSGEDLKQQLIREFELEKRKKSGKEEVSVSVPVEKKIVKSKKTVAVKKKEPVVKLSKLDRIKNNLKVIESKMNDI